MRGQQRNINITVTPDFMINAGYYEKISNDDVSIIIHPPARTMYDQVTSYLKNISQNVKYTGLNLGKEAVAMTAIVLRWGSYFAVLSASEKPLWPETKEMDWSRITDEEMARINIEASYALSKWIDLMRKDWNKYMLLMNAASILPMTIKQVKRERESKALLLLSDPTYTDKFISLFPGEEVNIARKIVKVHSTRILSNAVINHCYRNNTIIEDIHAGKIIDLPVNQRRITSKEERLLIRQVSSRFAQAILAIYSLIRDEDGRSWEEKILPFYLAAAMRVTPYKWSLDLESKIVNDRIFYIS